MATKKGPRAVLHTKTQKAVSAATAMAGLSLLAAPPAVAGDPGDSGTYVTFQITSVNMGQTKAYSNSNLFATWTSSSGGTSNTSQCNKYTGGTDGDGGGRLPPGWYNAHGVHNYPQSPSWSWTWSDAYNLGGSVGVSAALAVQDKVCSNGTERDGLYFHQKGSSWTSNGCIKLATSNLAGSGTTLDGWFHAKAGGNNNGDYTEVLYVYT